MTQSQNVPERPDIQPEMAFSDTHSRQQHVISGALPATIHAHLSHCITRNPKDLLAHVQRIHFASAHGSQSELYSTLLDLFIALGALGAPLRRVMLAQASNQLDPEQLDFLSGAIETGIGARDVINDSAVSILSSGYSGCESLVITQRHQGKENEDSLQQALASIECSDLEAARTILEDSLYSNQSNLDQQKLLLEIYRKTDDKKNFMALYETFEGNSNPAYADWQVLAVHFGLAE